MTARDLSGLQTEVLRAHAGWAMAFGALLMLLGILAIASPLVTGVAVAILVGTVLLAEGVSKIVYAFKAPSWGTGLWGLLGGALAFVCGLLVLGHPLFGLGFLTLLLAIFFLADGIAMIALAFQLRPIHSWGWTLFSGILTMLLGFAIYLQWPVSGNWAIGLMVGVNILLAGWTLLMLGSSARHQLPQESAHPAIA